MREIVERLAKKLLKISPEYGEELISLAQSMPDKKDWLAIDIATMESYVNPEKAKEDVEVPEIIV